MKTKLRDVTVYAVLLAIIVLWPFLVIGMGRNYVAKLWSENVSNFDLANSLLWFVFVMGVFVWVFRLRQAPRLLRATFTTVFLSGIILAAVFRNDSVAVSDKLFFLLNRTEFDEIVARSAGQRSANCLTPPDVGTISQDNCIQYVPRGPGRQQSPRHDSWVRARSVKCEIHAHKGM